MGLLHDSAKVNSNQTAVRVAWTRAGFNLFSLYTLERLDELVLYLTLKSGDGEWPPSMAARAADELPVSLFMALLVLLWVLLTADSSGVVAALC